MEVIPDLQIGWLNGWIGLVILVVTEGALFLVFPRQVVARLFDRSGWNPKQRSFTITGKLCALACLGLICLTPLKIEQTVFYIGLFFLITGWVGLVKALFDYKNTPPGEPVTRGIYKTSRHPQITMASLMLAGTCIAIGSWLALAILLIARLLSHFGIVAEEEVCLKQYGDTYKEYMVKVPRYFVFF